MTDIEYKFVDIIISKIPVNTPFMYYPLVDNLLPQVRPELDDQTFFELSELLGNRKIDVRKFLLENDYITCVNESYPKDALTETGKKVKELGGHKKYLEYLEKQTRKNFIIDFPKNYWYIVTICGVLFGFFTDIFKDNLKNTKFQTSQQDTTQLYKTIEILRDSVQYMLHQQKETLNNQKNLLPQQKNK